MKPIDLHVQEAKIQSQPDLPVIFCVVGTPGTLQQVSPARVEMEVARGVWDDVLRDHDAGPNGQSLLLTLLGSRRAEVATKKYQYASFPRDSPIVSLAKAMQAHGADPFARDKDGRDCMDQAFCIGETELFSQWLVQAGKREPRLTERVVSGATGVRDSLPWLHQACWAGRMDMVKLLLEHGFDPNQTNDQGDTPLFWADSASIVDELIRAGASPHYRNSQGMDAKVFWLTQRKLPQSTITPMALLLPKVAQKPTREQLLADFFLSAQTAGKGALVSMMGKLNLSADDKDSQGFGPVGNLGSRLLDRKSRITGNDRNKAINWGDHLMMQSKITDETSKKDWLRLWSGMCSFGGVSSLGVMWGVVSMPYARDICFWKEAVDDVLSMDESLLKHEKRNIAEQAASFVRLAMEREDCQHMASELGSLYLRCLEHVGLNHRPINDHPMHDMQNSLLAVMTYRPQWKLQNNALAWRVALILEPPVSNIDRPQCSWSLLDYLVEQDTPKTPEITQLICDAISVAKGGSLEILSTLQRSVLAETTPATIRNHSRVRL